MISLGRELRQKPVTVVCERGVAVFFSDLAVHGSHPNQTGGDRRSLISTYRSAAVHDESTVWKSAMLISGKSVKEAVMV